MAIQKSEIKRIASLFTLFLGFVILAKPMEAWLSSMVPTSAWVLGLGTLAVGAWMFQY